MHTPQTHKRYGMGIVVLLCIISLWAPCVVRGEDLTKDTAYLQATNVILRKQATSKSDPITQLDRCDQVKVLDFCGEWVYIAYGKHKGYVLGEYLSWEDPRTATKRKDKPKNKPMEDPEPAQTAASRAPGSALRLEDCSDEVKELQTLLRRAGYSVGIAGEFGKATEDAVRSYQKKVGLKADGMAGKQTLALLKGETPESVTSAGQVERLDWWSEGRQAFPVGTKATVVDARTGFRFTVKRWGGVNHADVEP